MPELEEELDGKKKKKEKKEKRKEKKEKKKEKDALEIEGEEEEKLGSKILLVVVTLVIILIWLAIFGLLIKMDVGGFGSTVLYPVFKNVPVVNKILPKVETQYEEEDTQYRYSSIEEAVERIKELELEVYYANNESLEKDDRIAALEAEVAELTVYKDNQVDFENIKEKFYEEVVFSEEAPDISEYKAYYESIDPENAAVLYKQVVKQTEKSDEIKDYIATYSSMKPKEAAAIFNTMTNNLGLVADILEGMNAQARADILGKMDAETAAKVTAIMEP